MSIDEKRRGGVREVEHVWIPVSGGVRLSARLWLPERRAPAVLEYIPYRKRDLVRVRDERNHAFFARHGYAGVRVDMRGSGDSEGLMTDMYRPEELDDALVVIEWIARQPWCDGSVGMMGTSWGGTASLQAAARRPEALRAIIAVCATDNRFDDDIHHMGGCLLTDSVEWGATLPAILALPPDPKTVGRGWRRMWRERLEGAAFPLEHWIRHETRDAYWRRGAVNESPGAIACPALLVGGWSDRYSNTVMNLLAREGERCWGIVGPWGHHYPAPGSPGPGIGFQPEALRWWDRWLRGVDNGVDREPRLRAWMQAYAAPRDRLARRPGRWIAERSWPSPNIAPRHYRLAPGAHPDSTGRTPGPAPASKPDLLRLASRHLPDRDPGTAPIPEAGEVGAASGDTGYFGREGGLPLDQQPDDARSLVFESAPLGDALEILGPARLVVAIESDRPIATLAARLNDRPPEGGVARVSYAIRNLALRDAGRTPRPLASGEPVEVSIDFPNTAYRFEAGHRIRLALSSGYWPLIWPSPRPARLRVHLARAHLALPVRIPPAREARVAFAGPVPVEDPETRDLVPLRPLERRTVTDAANGERSLRWHQPYWRHRFVGIDLEFGSETRAEHRMASGDPARAATRFEHRLHLGREGWMVEVTGIAELSATETAYHPRGTLEVRENGERVFERRWNPVIPRTCS